MALRTQNIVVEFAGGLGNQLFQYAFAQVLFTQLRDHAENPHLMYKIWLDGTAVTRDVKRKFHLRFMLRETGCIPKGSVILYRRKLFSLMGERIHTSLNVWEKMLHTVHPYVSLNKVIHCLFLSEEAYFRKAYGKHSTITHTLTERICTSMLPVFIQGFWQYSHIIKTLLKNANRDLLHIPKATPAFTHACHFIRACDTSISLHVRRTDYLNAHAEYPPCGVEYYKNAVAYLHHVLLSQHSRERMCVLVFSDDVLWCKNFLIPVLRQHDNLTSYTLICDISKGALSDAQELILMSLCTHHVLANSSFSWWGSGMLHEVFLPHQKNRGDGIVVAPMQWHGDVQKNKRIHMPHWVLL